MSTEATKQQSLNYGSLVIDSPSGTVNHYVEKPSSYISTFINCGVYICSLDVFSEIAQVFHSRELTYSNGNTQNRDQGYIEWEREVLTKLAGTGTLFALPVSINFILPVHFGPYLRLFNVFLALAFSRCSLHVSISFFFNGSSNDMKH